MRPKFFHTYRSIFSMSLVSVFACLTCNCSQLIYAIRCFSSSTVEVQRKIDQRSSLARKPLVPTPCNLRGVRPISIRFSWKKLPHSAFHMVLICSLKSGFAALGFQWDLNGINWLKMCLSFRLGLSGIAELSFYMVFVWYEIIKKISKLPIMTILDIKVSFHKLSILC